MRDRDIDWLAVEMVCHQRQSLRLRGAEMRAAIRRLDERLITESVFYPPPGMITSIEAARRLQTTDRSIYRARAELPPATKTRCPHCGEPMWVLADGTPEPHPTPFLETCRAASAVAS